VGVGLPANRKELVPTGYGSLIPSGIMGLQQPHPPSTSDWSQMSITVRASSFGGCIKSQVAACLGYAPMAPPDRMQEIFDRGHTHEDENAVALRADGWDITREQEEVRVDKLPVGSVVGHIDGVASHPSVPKSQPYLWESKSPNAWAKFEKAHKTGDYSDPLAGRYAWQISVYMHALGLEAYVTCWDEENGVRGFVIEQPPYTMQDITDRLISINEWVKIGQLPQLCTVKDYPCPFVYLHEDDVEVVDDPALDQLVAEYDYWAGQEKTAAEQKKQKQQLIRDHIVQDETVTSGGSKVTRYERKAAARYDMEGVRRTLMERCSIDLDAFLMDGKPSTQVRITRQDG
jgi:hypothetical protein